MGSETKVIMPVLGMSQVSGRLIRWIKQAGERVEKGEPLMEVETDKASVEIEAPASGILTHVTAKEGEEVPVAQVIAIIQDSAPGLAPAHPPSPAPAASPSPVVEAQAAQPQGAPLLTISPVAARMAEEHHLDPRQIKPGGGRIEKADVLDYLQTIGQAGREEKPGVPTGKCSLASPKARRLAAERGISLVWLPGSGPGGAVLAADVPAVLARLAAPRPAPASESELPISAARRRMVERLSASWPTTPHFYLMREVNATRLVAWRQKVQEQLGDQITYTDLLVKLAAAALRRHPQVNARFQDGKLLLSSEVNIGVAAAVEDCLVVPVIHRADTLSLGEIAATRVGLVERARSGKLRLEDLQGGTFTITNLGMYDVDGFVAIINPPQAAILAIGRITDRVVALDGQPAVQPVMIMSASFDHRVVDGARGAQFLKTLADWIEEPLGLLI
jgi:pyruvate dehydrogenase E2 component (dihydrolipoamide acetyltransferase)